MYLSAKLIGIASAIIATGTTSSFVIPYLKSDKNDWLFQKDDAKNNKDFKELDRVAEARIDKLTSLLNKFESAKTATEELKKTQFEKMKPLFENIFKVEEEIQRLFKSITESLEELVKKNETLFKTSTEKLDASRKQALQKELWDKYSTITDILKKWKNSLNQINCAIDNKERGKEMCNKTVNVVSDVVESISSFVSNIFKQNSEISGDGASGSAGGNGQSLGGAKQAEEGLKKVKEELSKALQDFNKQSVIYGAKSAYSLSKERTATLLIVVLEATIKSLNQQIQALTESINKDQESSNTKSQTVKEAQTQLENTYKDYSDLQRLETLFQWWKETFEEKITKNQDDKARETDLSLRRRK